MFLLLFFPWFKPLGVIVLLDVLFGLKFKPLATIIFPGVFVVLLSLV
jgi:hypothetical protein